MDEAALNALAAKIELLITRCEHLQAENTSLRQVQNEWQQERLHLMQKNDLARSKIEAMIGRLKALEQR
jgi:cell division protein ZapB